jgi:hypothetical protein
VQTYAVIFQRTAKQKPVNLPSANCFIVDSLSGIGRRSHERVGR